MTAVGLKIKVREGVAIPHKAGNVTFAPRADKAVPEERAKALLATYPQIFEVDNGGGVNMSKYPVKAAAQKARLEDVYGKLGAEAQGKVLEYAGALAKDASLPSPLTPLPDGARGNIETNEAYLAALQERGNALERVKELEGQVADLSKKLTEALGKKK
jgi:hypothetical protein